MLRRVFCGCLICWVGLGVVVVLKGTASGQIPGDVDGNGVLDAADIDLVDPLFCGPPGRRDVNEDGLLDMEDRRFWIHELKKTWFGDANLDGEFNSTDLVQAFAAGSYETDMEVGWEQGDWDGDHRFLSTDLVVGFVDGGYEKGPRLLGDYNGNGLLDAGDLDLQAIEMVGGEHPKAYDLNDDDLVDFDDRLMWVEDLKKTWMGDANLDLEFNTTDLIQMFVGGKYETEKTATWEEGDFTGDMKFDASDMVAAFPHGWPQHPKPALARSTVPEFGTGPLLTLGLMLAFSTARRRNDRRRPSSQQD